MLKNVEKVENVAKTGKILKKMQKVYEYCKMLKKVGKVAIGLKSW